jgi:hypothetical protein
MMSEIASESGTSPERYRFLFYRNYRLRRFVYAAERHGWTATPSAVAPDTIVVRKGDGRDHFVLYPNAYRGNLSTLTVYDGRDGYEFSPIPARTALSFIADQS